MYYRLEEVLTIKLASDPHNEGYIDGMTHFTYGWLAGIFVVLFVPIYDMVGFLILSCVFFFLEVYQSINCKTCKSAWSRGRTQDFLLPLCGYLIVLGARSLF